MWFVFMLAVPRHLRVAYVFISTRLVFKLSLQVCLNFASFVLMIASIGPAGGLHKRSSEFYARCYAERDIAMASRPSVRPLR